jgi:hypothetical protein
MFRSFLLVFVILSCSSRNNYPPPEGAQPGRAAPPRDFKSPEKEIRIVASKECVDSTKIDSREVCFDLYDPVCGCDSITYSNSCQAQKAGVIQWAKGTCK